MCVSSTPSITIQELKYSPFAATGKLPEFPFESSSTNFRTHSKKGGKTISECHISSKNISAEVSLPAPNENTESPMGRAGSSK